PLSSSKTSLAFNLQASSICSIQQEYTLPKPEILSTNNIENDTLINFDISDMNENKYQNNEFNDQEKLKIIPTKIATIYYLSK
ncbi:21014_t:CDS:1, partial [Racocetra persica]